jgi:hypothetical protein
MQIRNHRDRVPPSVPVFIAVTKPAGRTVERAESRGRYGAGTAARRTVQDAAQARFVVAMKTLRCARDAQLTFINVAFGIRSPRQRCGGAARMRPAKPVAHHPH